MPSGEWPIPTHDAHLRDDLADAHLTDPREPAPGRRLRSPEVVRAAHLLEAVADPVIPGRGEGGTAHVAAVTGAWADIRGHVHERRADHVHTRRPGRLVDETAEPVEQPRVAGGLPE